MGTTINGKSHSITIRIITIIGPLQHTQQNGLDFDFDLNIMWCDVMCSI